MSTLVIIIIFGLLMSAIALVGSITLILKEATLEKILLPLVAFASGSLIGGALFHLIPASLEHIPNHIEIFIWLAVGFSVFLVLEQVLHWHHCHKAPSKHKRPLTYLILVADGLHNLIGGLVVGASFVVDFGLGLATWIVAAIHEIPQELGDFGILVYGGWNKTRALIFNLLSGLTFLVGALIAYFVSTEIDVHFLLPFAAGNFLYIGAVDLIPEIKTAHTKKNTALHTLCFLAGMTLLLGCHFYLGEH